MGGKNMLGISNYGRLITGLPVACLVINKLIGGQ